MFSHVSFLQVSIQPVLASVVKVNPVKVCPVEPPSFVVTLIRRPCWPYTEKDIPHEIAVENCQSRDLMSTVLDKAITIDSNFYCGFE